jgi:amidase
LLTEAFALCDAEVVGALAPAIDRVQRLFPDKVHHTSLGNLCGDSEAGDLSTWLNAYRVLQGTEAASNLGAWIQEAQPAFGPSTAAGFQFINGLDRTRIGEAIHRREHYCRQIGRALGSHDLLCFPTAPTSAPLKGARCYDRGSDYYQRTLSLTSIAGVARLPQVSMPLGQTAAGPIGLSLLAAPCEDLFLLDVAKEIAAHD